MLALITIFIGDFLLLWVWIILGLVQVENEIGLKVPLELKGSFELKGSIGLVGSDAWGCSLNFSIKRLDLLGDLETIGLLGLNEFFECQILCLDFYVSWMLFLYILLADLLCLSIGKDAPKLSQNFMEIYCGDDL